MGTIVRAMRFQSSLSEMGITGCTLTLYWNPSPFGPAPKSKLFWMGTLMRLATGLESFLASSAAAALSSVAASCANSAVVEVNTSAQTSAAAMMFFVFKFLFLVCLLCPWRGLF